MNLFKKLNFLLTKEDKVFLSFLVFLSIFVALIETIGIAAIMPFVSVASDFTIIQENKYYKFFYEFFLFENDVDFVIVFGIILITFYILRGIINLFYSYLLAKFSKGRTHILAYKLFTNYLGMSYHNFINKNSSEINKLIINETQHLTLLFSGILLIISEFFVILLIYTVMLYVNWEITLVMTLFLSLNAIILIKTVSKRIKKEGTNREKFQKVFFEIINSTLSNFKIIKLQSNDNIILDKFEKSSLGFTKSGIVHETLSSFPRIFLETLGFGMIVIVIIYLVFKNETNIASALGVLSMFVLGLYRLLPSVNRILKSYNQVMYYHNSLDLIHNELMYDTENLANKNIEFEQDIKLSNVSFGYNKNKTILDEINLKIKKGDKIAFIGPSGSGKSTLVDIIIGLYKPNIGEITVDQQTIDNTNVKNWRKKVGYIPQSVYLFDGTVADNVSFGLKFDELKIRNVLEKAKILDFLEKQQNGINTYVGEGGIKLSGGQKQRIAIARALYQSPEILVLDEATSALDAKIEEEIMKEIYEVSQDKTLIIIAHRLSTIQRCSKVYTIKDKRITCEND